MLVSNQSGDFELRVSALSREDVYNMQQALATAIAMLAAEKSDNSEEIRIFALIQQHLIWKPQQVKKGTPATPNSSTKLTAQSQ